jgi:hypothetical protein
MEKIRLIPAIIDFEFDEYDEKKQKEFDTLGSETDDPIGQYIKLAKARGETCLLYTSPSPRDRQKSRMPSSA